MRVRWANLQPPPVKLSEDAVYQKIIQIAQFSTELFPKQKVDVFLRHGVVCEMLPDGVNFSSVKAFEHSVKYTNFTTF